MKQLLYLITLLASIQASSQVLYLETFDNIAGPTSGGAGTFTFPTNMLLRNVDNLTPSTSVNYVNNAWIRREDFANNINDSCAFSTSWYTPTGTANDFMWTPAIAIPTGSNTNLSWNAVAYDPVYPDGYEVRVMTTAPTGGTGLIGNQLTNSTTIFSVSAENTTWTSRTASLNAYAGQTVYIGFRNNSVDKFILLIDDIKVEALVQYDASVVSSDQSEYTLMPVSQASIPLGATITNLGSSSLTSLNLHVDVYNSSNVLVHSASSTAQASIATGASPSYFIAPYVPTVADDYTIKYYHTQNEIDGVTSNDTLTRTVTITLTEYARDNGIVVGGIGIGAGNGGYLGNSFTIINPAYLYSIRTVYNQGYTNEPYASVIWNTDVAGMPTTVLASTDTSLYPSNSQLDVTQTIVGGPILLPAGTYVVTSVEFDSTLSISQTNEKFTLGKMWVNWPTTPLGGWGNVEAFGASFEKPFIIRMNLGSTLFPLASEFLSLKGKSNTINNELIWTNNEIEDANYTYILEKSNDAKTWFAIYSEKSIGKGDVKSFKYFDTNKNLPKYYYRIQVQDIDNKIKYSNMIELFNASDKTIVSLYPNPVKDNLHVSINHFQNSNINIYDMQGKIVLSKPLKQTATTLSIKGIPSGIYQVKITKANEVLHTEKLIIE
ncbi:MAG: T9SS type A sorting domain-containing protein [Chitinophagaceae bacterium]